jgi:hypothetical protein
VLRRTIIISDDGLINSPIFNTVGCAFRNTFLTTPFYTFFGTVGCTFLGAYTIFKTVGCTFRGAFLIANVGADVYTNFNNATDDSIPDSRTNIGPNGRR